ncbi:uncharacterized protein LOC113648365 isoform X2 [Tachysurus fulvidraco]|uniref:uncharacterized protein LOC113648365 isoform X2 n=1 Tax=Tachysurus fulvidraco TaxID=1234273 RepID=UPI001FEF7FF4|nr:uncharacterized protein LOC113648365 isoform X2 [Tachysurus fulvidraco]
MRIQVIFGVLLIYTHVVMGSLFQDHVCRFNLIKSCYVAVGQRLHLQMPLEDGFDLKFTSLMLRYRKTQSSPPTPRVPRWQFVNDNKTMILTSAEMSDSGTYTFNIFYVDGTSKGSYTLQVNIEAQVSSVKVSYSCLSSGVMKVTCSADGDNLHFSWTSDFNTLPQLENGTSTVTLEQDHQGNITCHVENHVSRDHDTAELHQCPGSLFQDHVCRFTQSNQCYVAVGQQLYLQMPLEDEFDLNTTSVILRYRKTQSSPPTPNHSRWQFVNDSKTMILTSAERNDSGTCTLNIFDVDGRSKGSYTLQVNIEAQVSSVKVSYSCLSSGVMKVTCSADGDNLHFSWTSDFNTLPQLENGTSTVTLEQDHQGNITCHVENHVSRDHDTAELHQCPGSLFQDHVVCRFNQIKQCYVAVGQRLHLQMPLEDGFDLQTTSLILRYRKNQSSPTPTPRLPRWQFVNDNKTMILTSAERNDSGTYTLNIFDVDGRSNGSYTLQVNIEGSLFQDHVVCRYNQIKPCYVAVGQRLYLQMPKEDGFDLKTTSLILRYRKTQSSPPTPRFPRWQFVNDNKTMILTSAERNDSGTYTLAIYDVDGRSKGNYTLQVNIEAQVSSVKVSYSCLSSGVMKVTCSADGDNLHFSWTSDFNTLPQLENGTSTVTLEQDHQGNITCHVENHVSRDHDTAELHQCPGSLFQDHVCRFNQIKPCYVAVGQRLYLQMPLEDGFELKTTSLILTYRKNQSSPTPTPHLPRWQFVNDNKTMILTSAERNDSGTYTLNIFDVDGRSKGSYTLQVNIEAQVSSVNVSYSCLSSGVMKVTCSADGDNLHFSWTSDFNTLPQLENGTSTVTLEQVHQGNITCLVENHVSRDHNTAELHQCPGSLFQDHVCRFNQIKPCHVAVGQRLYLQMPLEDGFELKTTSFNLTYRKKQSSPTPTPHLPRWQFVNDNKTMILTSAERNDSGTYTLNIFDVDRRSKGSSTLQVNIEAQVSSVKVSYSCLSSGVMKVNCSADGDNLHFSWTSDFNTLPQLENGTSTVTLEQDHQGNITCHVENHVSRDHDTAELHQCPGSLFQDHDVCKFNQIKPCYVAVGQRLYLQMPLEDGFDLKTTSLILTYRKKQSSPTPTPHLPRWQFVNDNKTMILTSAERSDSGTYTLEIFDVDGRSKGSYTLQVNIEAQVSSVNVSYSCLSSGVMKVTCSADGDNLHFSWTSDFNTLPQLENGTSTVTLEQEHQGNITCHVENHVSRDHDTAELHQCPGSLFQDHVVCRFNQIKPSYVAVGQRLYLQMPLEDVFDLKTTSFNLTYRKNQSSPTPTPRLPRWQFVNDNKTLILTSAERSDSGTYTLNIYDVDGRHKGSYTLQVNIEAQVSSVKVSYSCLSSGVMKVNCSADGDNLHFSWTSDFNTLPQLENGTSTVTLEQDHQGNITCHVENHVSRDHDTAELHQCPGSLFQDHVVCRFNQIKPCYVAVGQRLHLQMPWEDGFDLKTPSLNLTYRKTQSSPTPTTTPDLKRWQFVNDNKTMILTSAERGNSGTYTLEIFNGDGRSKGSYTLQVNIEAQVSSVKLSYSCMFFKVRKVFCSADGDNLHFSWTSASNTRLEDDNKTLVLDKIHNYNVTCHVENHVSRVHNSINLPTCIDLILVILSSVCLILIVLAVLVFCVYKKRQGLRIKAPSQDSMQLVYAEVTHSARNRTDTRPSTSPAQYEGVEYGTVVTSNQKKKEDDVQYGELVFNTPAQKKCKVPKVQEDCVYSEVKRS